MSTQRLVSARAARRLGGVLLLAALTGPVWSQQQQGPGLPEPRLLLVFPMGAKAGDTVEVVVTGQDVDDARDLLFDVPGVKAELVGPASGPDMKKQPQPGVGKISSVKFKVTVPGDAPLGSHDLRVSTPYGVSNPRAFVVGDLKEINEAEPNNDVAEAQRVEVNTTVNGVISAPTDVDYYIFAGKKGQRVVVSCLAAHLDSKLYPALHLYRRGGAPLAFNRDYDGYNAVVDAVLPADDDYYVRLFAFTYTQGGPEHFYRLSISMAPWIDAVFPPVVEPGKETKVTVYGRNLPGGKPDPSAVTDGMVLEKATLTVTAPKEEAVGRLRFTGHVAPRASGLNGFEYRLKNESGTSNPYFLAFAQAPVVLDNENNDTPEAAQEVTLPCEIAGRIEKKRDRDWYRFRAKKGEVYTIEAQGERLGSPLNLYYTLRPEGAKAGQEFADNPETLHPTQFFTRSDDPPRQRFVAPADGAYLLQVSSREADTQAGPRHLYRVRITPERPDFNLVVMPSSPNSPDGAVVRQGGAKYYTVFAWRDDGFRGDIALSVEGLPRGVTCPPQVIAPDAKQGVLVVTAAADAPDWTGNVTVRGTAQIAGRTVVREARGATITWPVQQNVVALARLDRAVPLAVRDKAPCAVTVDVDKASVLAGDKVTIPLHVKRLWADLKGPVQVTAVGLPGQGNQQPLAFNNGQPLTLGPGKEDASAVLDVRNNAPPGVYTLVLKATGTLPYAKDPAAKNKPNVTITEVSTPITITVVPKNVAAVSVTPANPTAKIGKDVEVTVKVNRLFDYPGEFKVELVAPADVKGISAESVTIPAGKDEVKMTVKVAADAAQGTRNLTVRATAPFGEKTTTQEAKLAINVSK
jgi:hypothetical protein